jgi:glycosyltransferase involved in cell wall biosynthesis
VEALRALLVEGGGDALFVAPRPGQRHELGLRLAARVVRDLARRALQGGGVVTARSPFCEEEIVSGVSPEARERAIRFHRPGFRNLVAALRQERIDVVVPSMVVLPRRFPVPWVGYLSDCQHRHMPDLFTERDREVRDRYFRAMLSRSPTTVVNSRAALDDVQRFYPGHAARVIALPFSASVPDEWLEVEPGDVCERYGLQGRFFIVCNQFWKHKDHGTAIKGLARARRLGLPTDIGLVCTGKLEEPRDPLHIENLRKLVGELGLENRIHFLGFIPKRDQILLLKRALGVVQPTLFEGGPGGGAAYDAISLGVPLVVSDIPVNRELPPERVAFFPVRNPEALAAELLRCAARDAGISADRKTLRREGRDRRRRFGLALLEAALVAVESARG